MHPRFEEWERQVPMGLRCSAELAEKSLAIDSRAN